MEERGVTLDLEPAAEPTTDDDVFYNEAMVTNRDISTACLATYQSQHGRELTVCDALAASGIRGLRYLDEVDGIDRVVFNDLNPEAITRLEHHLGLNNVTAERAEVVNGDAAVILSERFHDLDMVDIDPFGSPAPYLDAAARASHHEAAIGVTATDLGPLYGSYVKVCRRRYGSQPVKNAFGHETGLRILLKEVFNTYARYDYAFEPLLCHHERHYHRIFGKVWESKKSTNRRLEYIGFMGWCADCGWRGFRGLTESCATCPHCSNDVRTAGPLWTGPLADASFAGKVADWLAERDYADAAGLASTVRDEADIHVPFYDTHELASHVGVQAPQHEELIAALDERGYSVARTHFTPQGVRTDAPIDVLHDVLTSLDTTG